MQLNNLPRIVTKKKKRLGRGYGSGVGAKSGRGTTRHQRAREKIKNFYEGGQNPITKKFPLLRGKGRNRSRFNTVIIKLEQLNVFNDGETVNIDSLIKKGVIKKKKSGRKIKIVSGGSIKKSLSVAVLTSKPALEAIIAAGGKIINS